MVFSDLFFLFVFLASCLVCYLLATWVDRKLLGQKAGGSIADGTMSQSFTARNTILVIYSLLFYAWGEPVYVLLMLVCVFINYLAGLVIDRQERHRKHALVAGLVCNILILGTFKYTGFFVGIFNSMGLNIPDPKISLPIGISFYTFQSISYLIDVYRRESPVQRRFVDLLLYISMFPQLIAGPIVRYDTVARELHDRRVSTNDFAEGAYRFLIGLGKKVILANQLSEVSDQFLAGNLTDLTTTGAWLGLGAFMLQIYFDFSGYSDMAIGMGRCLGFHFNENFNHPYISRSITEFWRRWHMSLGSFFRDYVYIPLGGNRNHQVANIFCVWFLTGMWHGASWNFILWGLYFGVLVTLEKYTLLKVIKRIPSVVLYAYSLIIVLIGWGIFYFDDFGRMTTFFQSAFCCKSFSHSFEVTSAFFDNFWLWVVAVILCMPTRTFLREQLLKHSDPEGTVQPLLIATWRIVVSIALLLLSVILLVGATNNAFIYTRF